MIQYFRIKIFQLSLYSFLNVRLRIVVKQNNATREQASQEILNGVPKLSWCTMLLSIYCHTPFQYNNFQNVMLSYSVIGYSGYGLSISKVFCHIQSVLRRNCVHWKKKLPLLPKISIVAVEKIVPYHPNKFFLSL